HAFQCARSWISDQQWLRRRVDGGNGSRRPNKGRADTTYPADGEPASSMRRGNEYHTLDVGSVNKEKRFFKQLARLAPKWRLRGGGGKMIPPNLVVGVGDHQSTNHSAHTVTNQNDTLVVWKHTTDSIKVASK